MTEKVLGFGKSSWWGCVLAWNRQPGLELEVTGGGRTKAPGAEHVGTVPGRESRLGQGGSQGSSFQPSDTGIKY